MNRVGRERAEPATGKENVMAEREMNARSSGPVTFAYYMASVFWATQLDNSFFLLACTVFFFPDTLSFFCDGKKGEVDIFFPKRTMFSLESFWCV